jgi:tight adherence protein B
LEDAVGLYFIILLSFVAVTLGIALGFQALHSFLYRDATRVRQRVEDEFRRGDSQRPQSRLFKDLGGLELGNMPELDLNNPVPVVLARPGAWGRLETLLDQANVRLNGKQLLGLMAGLGVALGTATVLLFGLVLGAVGLGVGFLAPFLLVLRRRNARRNLFLNQLPGAFELMARVVRAGQSVPQALQAVADSFEEPLAGEFASCLKQQNLGLRPEIAFQEMAQRTGILEMRIFAMAMLIQRQTGGNLSEVLDRLGGLIRDRLRLRKKVRSLTAEGRLQASTLLALPGLMFGVMWLVNRSYAAILLQHPGLIAATLGSMLLGALWIRRIINFEV